MVLQTSDDSAVGQEELQFAADVAAYFSKGRQQTAQSVIFTPVRNIRRAGAAGLVTFKNEKFISARPDRVAEIASSVVRAIVNTS